MQQNALKEAELVPKNVILPRSQGRCFQTFVRSHDSQLPGCYFTFSKRFLAKNGRLDKTLKWGFVSKQQQQYQMHTFI